MRTPLWLFFAVAAITWGSKSQGEVREWTRVSDGKKISAEFVGMKTENIAKIKLRNGHVFEVVISTLSPEDVEYLESQRTEGEVEMPKGETLVTLSGVHLCCESCEKALTGIAGSGDDRSLSGVRIVCDRESEKVAVTAPTGRKALAALEAMHRAGFYGVSDHPAVAIPGLKDDGKAADELVLVGLHLCCGGCVKACVDAVKSVDGVESCEAKKGAGEARVAGTKFSPYEVMVALRSAGFGGSRR